MADELPAEPKAGDTIEDDDNLYVVCAEGKCEKSEDVGLFCVQPHECKDPCTCMVIIAKKGDKKWEPLPKKYHNDHKAQFQKDYPKHEYRCICVRRHSK